MRSVDLSRKSRPHGPLARTCALILVAAAVIGCTRTTGSVGPTETAAGIDKLGRAAFCDVAEPIRWSATDTGPTVAQVKEHNAVGVRLCEWRGSDR